MRPWARRLVEGWVPGIVITLVGLALFRDPPVWLGNLELWTYDARMRFVPGRPDSRIVIVTVDARTVDKLGPYPLARHLYTDLVNRLSDAGAKVIGMDIGFAKPDPDDEGFAAAVRSAGNVAFGEVFLYDEKQADPPGGGPTHVGGGWMPVYQLRKLPSYDGAGLEQATVGIPAYSLRSNAAAIKDVAAKNTGFVNTPPDTDYEIRRMPLALRYQDLFYPSMEVQVVRLFLGVPSADMNLWFSAPDLLEELQIGGLKVPINRDSSILLNFRGGGGAFQVFSLLDVLKNHVAQGEFKGKIVLVGASDPMAHDIWPSPRGWTPGTEIVAHGIDSILNRVTIQYDVTEILTDLLILLLAGVGATWWLGRVRPTLIIPWTVAMLAALVIGDMIAFARWRSWLSMVAPALTLLMSCLWTVQRALVSRVKS
jgi:adenylate cyclase